MMLKPQNSPDNFDMSWIQREVECWINEAEDKDKNSEIIFKKGVIKGIVPLSFNKGNSKVICALDNGQSKQTKASNLQKRRHSSKIQKDLIDLDVINPAQILNQLKKRFQQKKIHTYMWNSLIIINPFVKIDGMYDERVMKNFMDKVIVNRKQLNEIQPHIYGFVCNILNNMKISQKAQMISISGQSGSGKTETNKQCLKIISYVCESHVRKVEQVATNMIQQRILNCDSVLECFGNAKTSKNDNSSRFGKLITEKINSREMEILYCEVKVFFLEKSRIIHQSDGERSFHIFYQLLSFCPENLRIHLHLRKGMSDLRASDFKFLAKDMTNLKQQDRIMWHSLIKSFQLLDISESSKKNVFEIIAAVLHLGNLQFEDSTLTDNDPCQIQNEDLTQIISELLMMDIKVLKEGLVFNKKQLAGEVMYLPMSKAQCIQNRDSIAKSLYENLFLWIVEQLNKKVNEKKKHESHIKVIRMLDIYGFQVFQHNSFQQLCVNYTNERIHQIYLDQVFKNEKTILMKQGLQSVIPALKFTDNSKIIDLLDTSYTSIFNLLDQSCSLNVKDQDFLSSVKKAWQGKQHFPPMNNNTLKKCFIVGHTPGDIEYMAVGFRNKNKDLLREDMMERLSNSKSPILSIKFKQIYDAAKSETSKKFLGFKIRKQVSALMSQMSFNSDLHFIRCIKPNQKKQPLTFIERVCYNQTKYLGILDTVRMRKDCYHVRMPYIQFYKKYGILNGDVQEMILLSNGKISDSTCREKTKELMDGLKNGSQGSHFHFLYGLERIFMRMETNSFLQNLLKQKTNKIVASSLKIQIIWKKKHNQNSRKNFTVQIRKIQKAMRSFLKDITQIKKRSAVRIIQREWIKRSNDFFSRKKRIPLISVQKYIKRLIEKKNYDKRYESISYAKQFLKSTLITHSIANSFQNHIEMKREFLSPIFDTLWKKMGSYYIVSLQNHLKSYFECIKNKSKIKLAAQKTYNRLVLKNKQTIGKYFKAVKWSKQFEILHNNVVKMQKFLRMLHTRLNYTKLKQNVIKIQRAWRKFKIDRAWNKQFTKEYFNSLGQMQDDWKAILYRSLKVGSIVVHHEGVQKSLQKFQRIKKDKMILFYYLLDFQILYPDASLQAWIQNYSSLTQQGLQRLNPIQYIDVSNTHTAAVSTSKIYTWGNFTLLEEYPYSSAKITKISAQDHITRLDSVNGQQIITNSGFDFSSSSVEKEKDNTNKQWSTVNLSFVLLNGIVLTMQGYSFAKLNIPEKVNQISCGMGHVICRTILKKVFTWGKNNCGQLGIGNYFQTNSVNPKIVEYFYKRRVPVCQVAASPDGCIVIDSNSKLYWFGSNGTIKNVNLPEQVVLSSKSYFLGNYTKYSPVRIISKWSKTLSLIGITVACHDGLLKNQIPLRKKVLQNLMSKWSEDISTINPPYSQSVADNISQRHMPLPSLATTSGGSKNLSNREIKQKIINDLQRIQQVQRELLRNRKLDARRNI